VDIPRLVEHVVDDGVLLGAAAERAGWDAPVPATDWNVRDLVIHIGGIHRWAADIVATCSPTADTDAGKAVGTGPADSELLEWFRDGHAALVETLGAATEDLDCFTFLPADSALHFWARRQAHETAVHRADAQAAAGHVVPFAAPFAQDGIAEILFGFARRKSRPLAATPTIGLAAADGPSWLITLGGERTESHPSDDLVGADATISGSSSDLYLWLWNRRSAAVVDGDHDVAATWAETVRVRWS
jgi:uncharacterized protein (TIGR03083 family)